jgi:hypothetical protein
VSKRMVAAGLLIVVLGFATFAVINLGGADSVASVCSFLLALALAGYALIPRSGTAPDRPSIAAPPNDQPDRKGLAGKPTRRSCRLNLAILSRVVHQGKGPLTVTFNEADRPKRDGTGKPE